MASRPKPTRKRGSSHPPEQHATEQSLRTLGKYTVQRKIGSGGMGTVYLALDPQLKRQVALKVLPAEKANNPTLVRRFKAEAQAAAQLRHENIVTIHEAGEADGFLFIALEYVDGTDVHEFVRRRGAVPVKRSIEMIRQATSALQHAYEQNIVHRDIKPSNLLIRRDGIIKLTDLGLARSVDDTTETSITRAGTTVGTVDYMSPEQARDSKAADIRSDIYSLGCTWYHMLTGTPPFPEGSVTNKLNAHASAAPPDPRSLNPSIPEGVVAVLHRMMAKSQEDRYQTPAELLADLEQAHLGRENLSDDVLAALVEEDTPRAEKRNRSRSNVRPNQGRSNVPTGPSGRETEDDFDSYHPDLVAEKDEVETAIDVPEDSAQPRKPISKRPILSNDDQQREISFEPMKALGLLGVVVCVLGSIWWMTSRFADAVDGSGEARNPFAASAVDQAEGADDIAQAKVDQEGHAGTQPHDANSPPPDQANTENDANQANRPDPTVSTTEPPTRQHPTVDVATPIIGENWGRPEERDFIPNWALSLPSNRSPEMGNSSNQPVPLRVGLGTDADFAALSAALEALPESGGTIELLGDGPFWLPPVRLAHSGPVVIRAARNSRPVVACVPGAMPTERTTVLHRIGGALTLAGLHLTAVSGQYSAQAPLTFVLADRADLIVEQCSVTLQGVREIPATAFRTTGLIDDAKETAPRPARVLFDRCFVRGNGLTALEVSQPLTSVLASNCLFVSGAAPVLRVSTGSYPDDLFVEQDEPGRLMQFLSCTFSTSANAFRFESDSAGNAPPETMVRLLNSIVASTGSNPSAPVLLALSNWPADPQPAADRSLVQNLQWQIRGSVLAGWQTLMESNSADSLTARGEASWQRIWRNGTSQTQFLSQSWPALSVPDVSSLEPAVWERSTLDQVTVTGTDGSLPGSAVEFLEIPKLELLDRVAALARRPIVPPALIDDPQPSRTVHVDLNRQDLGKVVSETDWPEGTLFVAQGTGNRQCSPIVVRGKSLRIEFVQGEGQPLTIIPRNQEAGRAAQPFISVAQGTIGLSNAVFRIQATTRQTVPNWFMHVQDGSFALRNVVVQGPVLDSTGYEGLIHWSRTAAPSGSPGRLGQYQHSGYLTDSYLIGSGTLIRADLRQQGLVARNSVLASLEDLFELPYAPAEPAQGGALELSHCTLSAAECFFRISDLPDIDVPHPMASLFVSHSVFAPPVDPGNGTAARPTLLMESGAPRRTRPISWWENANGYSPEVMQYLKAGTDRASSPQAQAFSDWQRLWKPQQVMRPLSAPGGVLLRDELPHRTKVSPTDFALHATANAVRWADDGQAIGADIGSFRDPNARTSESTNSDSKTNKTPRKTKPAGRPDF